MMKISIGSFLAAMPKILCVLSVISTFFLLSACGGSSGNDNRKPGATNKPPQLVSPASVSVAENNASVLSIIASDAEGDKLVYRLIGGADLSAFSVNSSSGALIFNTAPDYENPTDSNGDNVYQVEVQVSDGKLSVSQMITVTVTNVNEGQFGLSARPSNTSCEIPNAPVVSSSGVQLTRVFQNLSFAAPVLLLQHPVNSSRWYVLEQKSGLIKTFLSNDTTASNFADLSSRLATSGNEMGLLGMAFHPNFATNKYVYVYYSSPGGTNHLSIIDRYTASSETTLDLTSRVEIMRIDQPYSNHNGGHMVFGADGYLYIGMGDGGSGNDPENRAQDINSLLGKMLRIDVDKPATGKNYGIPADNPYVGGSGLDEIYALGLRNPWRWSFDRSTGSLILADVGQSAREEIDIITKGGNYGWRCYEGTQANITTGCQPQSSYIAPVFEYSPNYPAAVTGGYVYRGTAIASLKGSYIYSDFYPGPIWALSDPGGSTQTNTTITGNVNRYISAFAEDSNGELYIVDYGNGQIFRLEPSSTVGGSFPTQLSQTGCIDAANPLQMASGLVPYDVNAPFWSDGISKTRWMALPDGTGITIDANNDWLFPINSVLVKNFDLNGVRVESRLLVRHADGNWGGYSYEWNASQADASLVLNGKITTKQGQSYVYPSSSDCMKCHTAVTNYVLGAETAQLNRDYSYASTGITANQLATLNNIAYFSTALSDVPTNLPRLTDPTDLTASDRDRARAYLYTNCSQCHRQGGSTPVSLDFNISTADSAMNICNITPTHQIGGATAILSPGNASNSSFYLRMACRDNVTGCAVEDKMPPLGSEQIDSTGLSVIAAWINGLSTCP